MCINLLLQIYNSNNIELMQIIVHHMHVFKVTNIEILNKIKSKLREQTKSLTRQEIPESQLTSESESVLKTVFSKRNSF